MEEHTGTRICAVNIAEQETGETETNLGGILRFGSPRLAGVERETQCARARSAADGLMPEFASEFHGVASADPVQGFIYDIGFADVVVGPAVTDAGFRDTLARSTKADDGEIGQAGIAEAQRLWPVAGIELLVAVVVAVIGEAGDVQHIGGEG